MAPTCTLGSRAKHQSDGQGGASFRGEDPAAEKVVFMLPPIAPMFSAKQVLRARMKAERKRAAATRPDAAIHVAAKFMATIPLSDGAVVALYAPIGDELSTEPLARALEEHGFALALPAVVGKRAPLVFRLASTDIDLVRGAFGVLEPGPDRHDVRPTIVVCPLLAFSRKGARLGYGAGFYDRTLAALRASGPVLAVGLGYGAQEAQDLPASATDEPLDWIITEREAIRIR